MTWSSETTWFGISRGEDRRSHELKAAADKIEIGYRAYDGGGVFRCTECGQTSGISIDHLPSCETGKVLDAACRIA